MFKTNRLRIAVIIFMSVTILSFSGDLEYRDVAGGKLKMLIPKDFIRVPKQSYKLHYEGEPSPDDFYCNKDTSESVAFVVFPKHLDDMSQAKQVGQMALLDTSNKVHFNDTTSINGNKVYLLDMDVTDLGKLKSTRTFIINMHDGTLMGVISYNIALKKAWGPVSDQMLKSIKVN